MWVCRGCVQIERSDWSIYETRENHFWWDVYTVHDRLKLSHSLLLTQIVLGDRLYNLWDNFSRPCALFTYNILVRWQMKLSDTKHFWKNESNCTSRMGCGFRQYPLSRPVKWVAVCIHWPNIPFMHALCTQTWNGPGGRNSGRLEL